jgi:hypothetical protein
MVTVGNKKLVLVDAYQRVPNGGIEVCALDAITIGNIIKNLDCVKNHEQPLYGWRR